MTNVMTKQTSRQRILNFLRQHKGVSAEEVSLALRVTAANVRYHLSILVSDGRVKKIGYRPGAERGRPVMIYGLGDTAEGDNRARFIDALLSQFSANIPADEMDEHLEALARRLASNQNGEPAGHITRRLAATIEQLNHLGYASRWEAHAASPRILLEQCPYAAVIAKHPELCRMDAILIRQRLGEEVEQTARLEMTTRGTLFCQFVLKGRA